MEYSKDSLLQLLGTNAFEMYEKLNNFITDNYNVDQLWDKGGKYGTACLRYSRSGKTLCTLYFRQSQLGIWIIFGKENRDDFEEKRDLFSSEVLRKYDNTEIFHDGKWLAFDVENDVLYEEISRIITIKKVANRKLTMCGYCCDKCKAFVPNIKKNDERSKLTEYWHSYYDLEISPENMICDGCRCNKNNAQRIDNSCQVRSCVIDKKVDNCSECEQYPCELFLTRKGLSYEEAFQKKEIDLDHYYDFLYAFDNETRLDRKKQAYSNR